MDVHDEGMWATLNLEIIIFKQEINFKALKFITWEAAFSIYVYPIWFLFAFE